MEAAPCTIATQPACHADKFGARLSPFAQFGRRLANEQRALTWNGNCKYPVRKITTTAGRNR
jgi:hypothetical protein